MSAFPTLPKQEMSGLLDLFYTYNTTPGSRILTGRDGTREVHRDIINTGKTVYLIRMPFDSKYDDLVKIHCEQRKNKGIRTIALTPETPHAKQYATDGTDEKYLFERTMISKDAYTSPVEILIYRKKVTLISYGEEEIATVITFPLMQRRFGSFS